MRPFWIAVLSVGVGLVAGLGVGLHLQTPPAEVLAAAATDDPLAMADLKREMVQIRLDMAAISARSGAPQDPDAAAPLQQDLRDLRGEVARLVAELADMRARQEADAVKNAPSEIDDEEFDPPDDVVQAEQQDQEVEAQEKVRQHFRSIETAFAAEPVDQAWSPEVTARVKGVFANDAALADMTLAEVDCRASRCRLEVWHDDGASLDELTLALVAAMPEESVRLAVDYDEVLQDEEADGTTAIVYLALKGSRLVPR